VRARPEQDGVVGSLSDTYVHRRLAAVQQSFEHPSPLT
jgi:hypothetical protein